MKVRVITSCTGEKLYSPEHQLKQDDFLLLHDLERFEPLEERLAEYRLPAEELYTGQQHVRLMEGVRQLRKRRGAESVELWILSAGYGLIPGHREVVPYECTFQGMKAAEIDAWAKHLQIPQDARELFSEPADLVLVLLGDSYLRSLALDDSFEFAAPTLFFAGRTSRKRIKGKGILRVIPVSNPEAKRFSCGLVGLKGELAKRILLRLADEGEASLAKLLDPETDVLALLDQESPSTDEPKPKEAKRKARFRSNPTVDYVIQIPESWWNKPHRDKLRYFIPEWDDHVDPDYDFETDTHSGGRGDWSNEVYAHQMYREPNYDGILMSRAVVDRTKKKKRRINEMGVHRYLRVPPEFPIMGDCGAFDYIKEEVPPYTTEDVIDYYTRLGFNYGVSVDHLILSATEEQKQFRYQLTIQNAEEFLGEHQKMDPPWTPIGAVQGWDAHSYAEAARQYVAMGYEYIALGGLVRTSTQEILRILGEVHQVVPETVNIHLFGLARIKAISEFVKLGVSSVDSASYLRQAWMRTKQSYLLESGSYAALRIPETGKSFRAKRMIEEKGLDEARVRAMEQEALRAVRALAKNQCSVDDCLNALLEYDQYITSDRTDMTELYRRTLTERPWEQCDCALCQRHGIEILVFRGNNRNRRRGFHNTYVFYQLVQRILNGEEIVGWASQQTPAYQLSLFQKNEG